MDARGVSYSFAYFSPKRMGVGQFYLMTIKDKDGNALDGAATYGLHLPANVPVHLYWSATAYDRASHTLIRDMPWASRSSNTSGYTPTPTAPLTFTSGQNQSTTNGRTGSPPNPADSSRSSSAYTDPTNPCSTNLDTARHHTSRMTGRSSSAILLRRSSRQFIDLSAARLSTLLADRPPHRGEQP